MSTPSTSLLIVDDHALFRAGLALIFAGQGLFDIIHQADSIDAVESLKLARLDLVLLDIEMPDQSGIDGLRTIKSFFPDTPVIMLSAHSDPVLINKAKRFGASGFLRKALPADDILSAVQSTLAGSSCFPDARVVSSVARAELHSSQLTPRQMDVLHQISEGKANKMIARDLKMSENTVSVHVSAILDTLGASNRTQAILLARQMGIL